MAETPLGFPYPTDSDYGTGADVPRAVSELADALDDYLTGTYKLVSIRYITTGTVTFTPTAGVDALYVECVGGGGAGGGCTTGATNSAAGGGGGGGGYAAKWITTMKSPFTVAVGAGGVAAQARQTAATVATRLSIRRPSAPRPARREVYKRPSRLRPRSVAMGGNGSGAVGDFLASGANGSTGYMLAAAQACSGNGGATLFGGGGQGKITQAAGGAALLGYGGGGGGGCILSGGASVAGGNGAPGVIRVWEFRGAASGGS
jgi:hypothetical protein